MRPYDRADEKQLVNKLERCDESPPWLDEHLYDFFYREDRGPTMDQIKKGWLLYLLAKLGVRSAERVLKYWDW